MTLAVTVLQQELLPEGLNISFKLLPGIIVVTMMLSFLGVGYFYKVADTGNMWVAGRSIGNVENGMAIGANWMSAASYLGMAALIALSGVYGLAYVVGWTTGYFILLIFLAAQMRRFGKYTAPDFVGDRFNSDTARALAAVTTFLIGFVYALGQARGMGLVGMYILGDITTILPIPGVSAYQAMMILFMVVTVGYLALSGMLGATKNMVLQFVILIGAFLIGLLVTGWSAGFSTVLPQLEYGALISELSAEFSAPFAGGSYYLWVATCFSLVFGTCGLPHVLVRFYTVQNERVARWSCTWGLFFICLLYLSAPAFAAFGTALYGNEIGAVYGDPGMSSAAADVIVVLASQLAGLPTWLVGLVAAGGIAAALSTAAGLLLVISSAISHDLVKNIFAPNMSDRGELLTGRIAAAVAICVAGYLGYDPPGFVAQVVAFAFGLAAASLFPAIIMGIFSTRINREGAIAGMLTGLLFTFGYILYFKGVFFEPFAADIPENWLFGISPEGIGVVGMLLNFGVAFTVSRFTAAPPVHIRELIEDIRVPRGAGGAQTH